MNPSRFALKPDASAVVRVVSSLLIGATDQAQLGMANLLFVLGLWAGANRPAAGANRQAAGANRQAAVCPQEPLGRRRVLSTVWTSTCHKRRVSS